MPTSSTTQSEDCLYLNVVRPANITADAKLPVWITGGAFETGNTSACDGIPVVYRSQALGSEAIYLCEVQQEGVANLGLYDQQLALQLVQEYIATFGSDPCPMYDQMVEYTNCTNPIGRKSNLNCLRARPTSLSFLLSTWLLLLSYQSLATSFGPVFGGVMFKRTSWQSLEAGLCTKIPIIGVNVDDEGTPFALPSINVTYIPLANETQVQGIGELYPSDPAQVVIIRLLFGTGNNDNMLTPKYKRISAFQGDYYFQVPRRSSLSITSATQKVWSYFHFAYNLDPNVSAGGYKGSPSQPSQLSFITWPPVITV
ncbi:alpha/beta-hydrolase [Gyrodon lividus]|nr:alpha/beta-hydrolase [Gyrodon lividus]